MQIKKRIHLTIGSYQYSMTWVSLLFTILVTAALLSLSYWQYQRGVAKSVLQHHFKQATTVSDYHPEQTVRNHQRVALKGAYLSSPQFLLDNQFYQHRFGYHVISPFRLETGAVVLVNRGYIPGDPSRKTPPVLKKVTGSRRVVGRVHKTRLNRFIRHHVINNPGDSQLVIEQIDFAMIGSLLRYEVLPWLLWLDADQADGFTRDWHVVTLPPERHYGYALQWFLLAVGFLLAMIIANTRK